MSEHNSPVPPKGSAQWKKNEKLIASNPVLRKARDIAEGFSPSSGISVGANTSEEYKANFDKIDFSKKLEKSGSYRVKINGRYVDEDDQS